MCAVLSHLICHTVSFQHVLEGVDSKTKLFGDPHQLKDFISSIAMGMDRQTAVEYVDQRIKLQISSRRDRTPIPTLSAIFIRIPFPSVLSRLYKRLTDNIHYSHA